MRKRRKTFISSKYFSMLLSGTAMMFLTAIMSMADTLIAGIVLGEDAMAGVTLALPLYSMASFVAVALSYGVPIMYAGEIGAFRREEADRCFGVGLLVTMLAGALMFLPMHFGGGAFLRYYQPGSRVLESAESYLSWLKYAVLLLPLHELMDGMVFADGDEAICTIATLVNGLLKIALSVVLCRHLGPGGLSLASFISLFVSLLIACLHFFRKGNSLKPNLAFSPGMLLGILKYGVVDGSGHLFLSLFMAVMNAYVMAAFGPEMLTLVAIIALLKEAQLVFEGIGEAITPIISTYLGEETYPGVREVWRLACRSLQVESLIVTAFLVLCAPQIIEFLEIEDPAIATHAVWGLRLMSLATGFTCRMFLDSSYFILVDKIPLGVLDCLLRDLIPTLPLAILGGWVGGVYGMFVGLTIGPMLGYVLSVFYVNRKYGRGNYALFLVDREKGKIRRLYEFVVSPQAVVQVRDQIGELMAQSGCSERLATRTMLLFEELFMLIFDNNPGKTVLAECSVELGESVRLITKDDGKILDLTNDDREVSSLRSYIVSNLLTGYTTSRIHFTALSYNRNALEIPME